MRKINLRALALDADEPKCAVCGSNVEEAQGYSRKAWCSECGKLQPMREKQNVWGPTKAKDTTIMTPQEVKADIAYQRAKGHRTPWIIYNAEGKPVCVVGSEEVARVAKKSNETMVRAKDDAFTERLEAQQKKPHPFAGKTKDDTCYYCGQGRMATIHRKYYDEGRSATAQVGAKDAVVEKYRGYEIEEGETGAVRVVGLGHRYAQYFKGWSRASAVEAAKRAIDRELAKPEPLPVKPEDIIRSMYTDRVPGKAKDAKTEIYKGVEIGEVPDSRGKWYVKDPASGQHLKMPDKYQAMGWAEAYERKRKGQEPNHMYDEGRSATAQVGAKDDREYPMPVHRLTGRNPDRCAQCGRPQSDLIHNCTNRFATDRRAKDQVPQDCFDAQIMSI